MSDQATEGTSAVTLPDAGGDAGPMGGGTAGVREVHPDALREGLANRTDHRPAGESSPDPDRTAGSRGVPDGACDPNQTGTEIPPQRTARKAVNKHEVALALRTAGGDQKLAAIALGISQPSVSRWIQNDDQLRALYGRRGNQAEVTPAATQVEAMRRMPGDRPPVVDDVELAELVTDHDNEILSKGLKRLGMSDELVKKIKDLDRLAESSGKLISVSLQKTHGMYLVQLFNLMEMADALRLRLNAKHGDDGFEPMSNMDRAFLLRNYTDMVKEAGNGYKMMLTGAQVMTEMLLGSESQDGKAPVIRKKPGWGRNAIK